MVSGDKIMNNNFDHLPNQVKYISDHTGWSIDEVLYNFSIKQIEKEYDRLNYLEQSVKAEEYRKNYLSEIAKG